MRRRLQSRGICANAARHASSAGAAWFDTLNTRLAASGNAAAAMRTLAVSSRRHARAAHRSRHAAASMRFTPPGSSFMPAGPTITALGARSRSGRAALALPDEHVVEQQVEQPALASRHRRGDRDDPLHARGIGGARVPSSPGNRRAPALRPGDSAVATAEIAVDATHRRIERPGVVTSAATHSAPGVARGGCRIAAGRALRTAGCNSCRSTTRRRCGRSRRPAAAACRAAPRAPRRLSVHWCPRDPLRCGATEPRGTSSSIGCRSLRRIHILASSPGR